MQGELTIEHAKKALFLGKAIVTFQSITTGKHFTYKIKKSKDNDNLLFVSVLTGPDNWSNYSYIGIIQGVNGNTSFRTTAKSRFDSSAQSVVAFEWTLRHLMIGDLKGVRIFHEGKCLRCGRKLTVPESIQNGIGPECIHYFH
jgi:hypothetical protein